MAIMGRAGLSAVYSSALALGTAGDILGVGVADGAVVGAMAVRAGATAVEATTADVGSSVGVDTRAATVAALDFTARQPVDFTVAEVAASTVEAVMVVVAADTGN